jgi:hypothetical protein
MAYGADVIMKHDQLIQYIRADGTIINLHSPPARAVMNMAGWGYPPVNIHAITGPFQHGESVLGYRFQPRTISMDVVKTGCSRSEWFDERTRLIDRLGLQTTNPNLPELGRLQWEYIQNDAYVQRAVDCYLSRGLMYEASPQWFEFGILSPLEFIASDPIIYDPNQITALIDTFTDTLVLPMTFPFLLGTGIGTITIVYTGSWITFPIIEIVGPTNGFKIVNETTNTSIELDYFVNAGITVTIDLTPNFRTVEDNLGNNLIEHTKNSNLAEFAVENVGNNVITAYVAEYTADTEIRIKYYSRYVGI